MTKSELEERVRVLESEREVLEKSNRYMEEALTSLRAEFKELLDDNERLRFEKQMIMERSLIQRIMNNSI